jgi:hypothetical protein
MFTLMTTMKRRRRRRSLGIMTKSAKMSISRRAWRPDLVCEYGRRGHFFDLKCRIFYGIEEDNRGIYSQNKSQLTAQGQGLPVLRHDCVNTLLNDFSSKIIIYNERRRKREK